MQHDLTQEAISAALAGSWDKARSLNLNILKENPKEVDALNRLARAYSELGEMKKARSTALKVLKFDPFNAIATKSISKWKGLKKGISYSVTPSRPDTFLEEPGKTKIVSLIHLGDPNLLAKLDAADEVVFNSRSHRISVVTGDGKYIGRLPDDISARLKKLLQYGNSYQVYIMSIDKKDVKVFIRETSRSAKIANFPSFQGDKIDYVSFTPPELVHNKKELEIESEEE